MTTEKSFSTSGDMPLGRRSVAPRYSLVEQDLREQMSLGVLNPNDRLPTETDLAVQYGVSRSVIRQALDNLERDDLVVRMRAKGTFITESNLALPASLLASFSSELDLHGIEATSQVLVNEIVTADAAIVKILELDEGVRIPYVERLRLGGGEVLGWDATWVHPVLAKSLAQMDFERDVLFDMYREAGHTVHSVVRRVRAVTAGDDLASKMSLTERAPLLEITRVVRDASGMVLDRQIRAYRGDRFSLTLDSVATREGQDASRSPRLRFDG